MYFYPLNFLRFVLALGVILFHYGTHYFPFDAGPLNTLIKNSGFRVSFFFFISGFVMCMVYGKQNAELSAVHFYKRRAARIFPVYWLAFIFTLLVVLFVKGATPKGLNILLHGLGLQSLNPGHVLDLNYPTWSISVELIFYLLFPFVLKWILDFSAGKLLLIVTLVWILQSLQHILFVEFLYDGSKITEEFISAFPLWHLSTFFAGMVTARFVALGVGKTIIGNYSVLFFLLALAAFAYIIYVPNPFLKYVHNGLLAPVFAVLLLSLFYDQTYLSKTLSHPQLSSLGDFSYGLFIFQYPVWVVCSSLPLGSFTRSPFFFLAYLMVLFVFAGTINRYFEKPFLKKLRKE